MLPLLLTHAATPIPIAFLDHTTATPSLEAVLVAETVVLALILAAATVRAASTAPPPATLPPPPPSSAASATYVAFFLAAAVRYTAAAIAHARGSSTADVLSADPVYSAWWRLALFAAVVQSLALVLPNAGIVCAYDVRRKTAAATAAAAAVLVAIAAVALVGAVPTLGALAPFAVVAYAATAALWAAVAARTRAPRVWAGAAGLAVLALIAALEPVALFDNAAPARKPTFSNHTLARIVSLLAYPAVAAGAFDLPFLVDFPGTP